MTVDLKMPDLATTDSEIKVTRWLVDAGQGVARGQPLLEVETDKAAMEVESYLDGVLSEVVAQPGDTVEVGQVIARLCVPAGSNVAAPAAVTEPVPAAVPAMAPPPAAAPARSQGGLFARNRQAAAARPPAPAPTLAGAVPAALPLGPAARTAARRLQESKQTIPHFYLQRTANAAAMQARRAAALPRKLAWDAFFVRAAALALKEFPRLACRWEDGQLIPQEGDRIGVAVALDDDLFVVSVPDAAGQSIEAISDAIRAGAERLRRADPEARKLSRNMMTISNLGSSGVEAFAAIINPPEAAILAVGAVAPAVVAQGRDVVVQPRVTLTLSVDHRVAGGRYAAAFLGRVVEFIEGVPAP